MNNSYFYNLSKDINTIFVIRLNVIFMNTSNIYNLPEDINPIFIIYLNVIFIIYLKTSIRYL
jgi:hypothetical protein